MHIYTGIGKFIRFQPTASCGVCHNQIEKPLMAGAPQMVSLFGRSQLLTMNIVKLSAVLSLLSRGVAGTCHCKESVQNMRGKEGNVGKVMGDIKEPIRVFFGVISQNLLKIHISML